MAKGKKHGVTPTKRSQEITVPGALVPIMQAFHVDSKKTANVLIDEMARAIYGEDESGYCGHAEKKFSKQETDFLVSLVRGLDPHDILESLIVAQVIVSHMLGMKKLSSDYPVDQKLGLNLLRFSSESIQRLDRKRNGGIQNITVNYNHQNALIQAIIPNEEPSDANSGC